MTKREVVRKALQHERPPYVPWSCGFTVEARQKLVEHFGDQDLEEVLQNHILVLGSEIGFFEEVGPNLVSDVFGVVWDRSIDRDIGNVRGCVLPEPSLGGYEFPDPLDRRFFEDIPAKIERFGDRFRVYSIGFSLYERAWTLRGMENLLSDMVLHPGFVHELLDRIADYNVAQVREALTHDIDGVYFGDDWGQQQGLIMGPSAWRTFFRPALERMYGEVRAAGKFVMIHSCGDVDELFDELIDMGLDCFNPFQPEVMDVFSLFARYRGRLAFHGGLSTQRTLPYGRVEDVKHETRRLLEAGERGGYIFAPAHDVEGDVPLQNILAFLEAVKTQSGFLGSCGDT
jgi:uroporphyrinogen decarboxylase